mgnify:CR=1 FL=1
MSRHSAPAHSHSYDLSSQANLTFPRGRTPRNRRELATALHQLSYLPVPILCFIVRLCNWRLNTPVAALLTEAGLAALITEYGNIVAMQASSTAAADSIIDGY